MNRFHRFLALLLIGLSVGLSASCGRKTPQATAESEIADAVAKLPGAAEVKAAVDKKDYEGGMAALLKLKTTIATEEQQTQFMALNHWFKNQLIAAAPTDSKAAEVLAQLRAMSVGR